MEQILTRIGNVYNHNSIIKDISNVLQNKTVDIQALKKAFDVYLQDMPEAILSWTQKTKSDNKTLNQIRTQMDNHIFTRKYYNQIVVIESSTRDSLKDAYSLILDMEGQFLKIKDSLEPSEKEIYEKKLDKITLEYDKLKQFLNLILSKSQTFKKEYENKMKQMQDKSIEIIMQVGIINQESPRIFKEYQQSKDANEKNRLLAKMIIWKQDLQKYTEFIKSTTESLLLAEDTEQTLSGLISLINKLQGYLDHYLV